LPSDRAPQKLSDGGAGPGRVYAVDIQPEMLTIIHKRIQRRSVRNIPPAKGQADDPRLLERAVDALLLVDAYHEFC
jgi:ubiquinone/menaquinone biosynthesis C-methylase UbiE